MWEIDKLQLIYSLLHHYMSLPSYVHIYPIWHVLRMLSQTLRVLTHRDKYLSLRYSQVK